MRKLKTLVPISIALLAGLAVLASCYPVGTTPTPGVTEDASSIIPLIVFLVLIFAMFYLLIIRPQRKRQKDQQQLMSQLRKGDKVLTAGGIYGVIEGVSEDSFVIRIESGATMRVAKGSVLGKRD